MKIPVYAMSLLMLMGIAMPAQSDDSKEIYQWKDSAGVTHFTDNPMQVPPKYKKTSKRGLKSQPAVSAYKNSMGSSSVWGRKCVQCHSIGSKVTGKVDLSSVAIDPITRFPSAVEVILPKIKMATEGRLSDMPKVKVSSDELRALAEYMLSQVSK